MASFKCAMKLSELLLEEDIEELLRESGEDELSALSDALSCDNTLSYCVDYALFFHTGNIEFLHRAIEIARCMLDQPLADDGRDSLGDRAALFSNLSRLLETRFQCAGDIADLVCAISFAESALNLTSPDHEHSKTFTEHLDSLVAKQKRVSDLLQMREGDTDQGDMPLHVLADKVIFLMRYRDYQASIGKHDEALELGRVVVQTSSPRHPDLVDNLLELATILTRPQDDGSVSCGLEEIQEALGYCQRAADLCAAFSDHSKCLRNLSMAYMSLSALRPQNTAIVPLDNAISVAREALSLLKIEDPRRPIYLFSLGSYLRKRFEMTSEDAFLAEAFEIIKEAYALCKPHEKIAMLCGTELGVLCAQKYDATSDEAYLHTGIDICGSLLETRRESAYVGECMHVLAQLLRFRADKIASYSRRDLDRAVELATKAVAEAKHHRPGHPTRTNREANLAIILHSRSLRLRRDRDFKAAHEIALELLSCIASTDPAMVAMMKILVESATAEYDQTGAVSGIDFLVAKAEECLGTASPESRSYFNRVFYLARLLTLRARLTRDMKDMERAIAKLEPVVRCTKSSAAYWGMQLDCFSQILVFKHKLSQKPEDLERAVGVLCEIWNSENTAPSTRVCAAYEAAGLLVHKADWEMATSMLEGAIELLPFTSPRHTPLDDKAFSLTYFRGLVSLAMAAALQAGRPLEEVVEIVEHGRGIIFGNRFQIQADIARVRDKNHQLAEQYEQVRDAIDAPEGSGSLMKSSQRREALRGELQCVIEQIRALGFDDFPPGPTPATRLIKAAELKPIIIVNGNNIRSDALVLKGSDRGLIPIRLPKLRHSQVHEMADKLRRKDLSQQQMFDLLKWLWDCIVRPIFTTPGILESPENGGKPHVRWIPLGPLGALPIHAAGDYFCESSLKQTALDYAFSSYVPSIKALLYSQDSRPHREVDAENEKFLLVSMENTDGHAPLPYARKEINLLAGKLPADRRVVLHSPSSLEVSHALRNSRIFHFAGHGFSHPKEPLQSSLLLNDQPLTVGDILNVNTNKAPPFLAFLSACSTGTSRRVEDEGIHLMSAFQLIGYRHVIGSLWELSDEHCVHVAGDVYDHLIASGTTDDSVCHALHRAVMRLRHGAFGNSSNRTSRELAADCEEEDSSWWNLTGDDPRIWAAYIHMGL